MASRVRDILGYGDLADRPVADVTNVGYYYTSDDQAGQPTHRSDGTTWVLVSYADPIGGGAGDMLSSNNLSDLDDAGDARDNLGLGTMAVEDAADYVAAAMLGANNGVATLDAGGLIDVAQLPPLSISDVWVVASEAAMLALTAQRGDVAIRTDEDKTYILSTNLPGTLADWKQVLTPGAVLSVAGKTGNVTLEMADITDLPTLGSMAEEDAGDYEPALGNPAANGYVLQSTSGGTRSWAPSSNPVGTASGNFLLSGGQVVYTGSGLVFNVSAATYYIQGVLYSSAEQQVTLSAAHATLPRIDVIALDTSGTAVKIDGTAAATPLEPDVDPNTQLQLTFVQVPATATSITGITSTSVYLENTEWTSSTNVGGEVALASTNNPRTGTKDIETTAMASNTYIRLQAGAPIDLAAHNLLIFFIRNKAAWAGSRSLTLRFLTAAGAAVGTSITFRGGVYGFDSTATGSYQQIAIPLSAFIVPPGTMVSILQLLCTGSGSTLGFYLDDITIQAGTAGTTTTGITQAFADARYAIKPVLASQVTNTPYGYIAATNVQAAINELVDELKPTALSILSGPVKRPIFSEYTLAVNAGSAEFYETSTGWELYCPNNGSAGDQMSIVTRALPAGTAWTIETSYTWSLHPTNYNMIGLGVRNSSSGKFLILVVGSDTATVSGGFFSRWGRYNNTNNHNAWVGSAATINTSSVWSKMVLSSGGTSGGFINAGTLTWHYGTQSGWWNSSSYAENVTTFVGSFDQLCFLINPGVQNRTGARMGLHSFFAF